MNLKNLDLFVNELDYTKKLSEKNIIPLPDLMDKYSLLDEEEKGEFLSNLDEKSRKALEKLIEGGLL